MAEARWSYYRFTAWAVLGGKEVDVVGFQVDFELNAIPRAVIRLPLVRSAETGAASPIHGLVQGLVEQTPVQLWVGFEPTDASDVGIRALGLPGGPFKLFDGYTAGGGYVRNNQGIAQYALTCNHWLVKLNQASALSDSSHPGNPAHYSYGALTPSGADTGGLNWTVLSEAHAFITPGNLAADVWGSALLPWLNNLAAKDGLWVHERGLKGAGDNSQAREALGRLGGTGAVAARPRGTISIDVDVAAEIANDVALLTYDPDFVAHQTMWDILVGKFSPDYLLAVVPRVDNAVVVPYLPCRQGAEFETLFAQEYVVIQLDAASPRPLRGYGILSSLMTRSGADGFADDAPPDRRMGVGGWYDTEKDGAVIFQHGPRWMGAVLSPGRHSDQASGGNLQAIGNAQFPGQGVANGARDRAKDRAVGVIKPLLDAYAKARYAQAVLQGRGGVVAGPFRVDVAPGSLVKVEGASEQFIADRDQFGMGYFAEVLRVSLVGDAEARSLGTAFHLGYNRTAAEQEAGLVTVDGHPLYEEAFKGVALVDAG